MTFLSKTINHSFIGLSLVLTALVSCETEETGVEAVDNEVTLTEEEFWEAAEAEQENLDEDNVPIGPENLLGYLSSDSDELESTVDSGLAANLDGPNHYFYVQAGAMKNWDQYRIAYDESNYAETSTTRTILKLDYNGDKGWVGVKAWGSSLNRATLWLVPYSSNNNQYYWGKSRTYYPWFGSSGSNTLTVTANSWDPNGN